MKAPPAAEVAALPAELQPPPLSVRLFGELDLRLGETRPPPVESARARSLLGFLLVHRDAPQSRQRLAFLLWPDSSEAQARTNLRHLIHVLRRAAPEVVQFLEVTAQTLWWKPSPACSLDIADFDAALKLANAADVSARNELAALRTAIELYTGDLLEGCYDEWVLEVRERFRDRYLDALQRVASALAAAGEHLEAGRVGRELLRRDALREDTYRFLMGVYSAAGDRAGAVRLFHECVAVLQRELGVEPSTETTGAYANLMQSESMPTLEAEPVRVSSAALVGRDTELAQLQECWRGIESSRAGLALITGEPGVGKTRLVEELAAWCAHRGALVAQARSYTTEGELGYGVAISWLRTGDVFALLRRGAPSDLATLARLLPELGEVSSSGSPESLNEAEQRQRVFEAIGRSLASSGRPILLIADDAQWCDQPSLQLIHYLIRLDPGIPLLVAATARLEDLDDTHRLGAVVGALQMMDRITEVAVERLTRAETEVLLNQLAGNLEPAMVDALFADTEGNPLFIVETVRVGWDHARDGASEVAPKLHAVISARLRQLSKSARELLDMAATVGREFTAPVVANASVLDDLDVVRCLDELWRRGLIREHGTDAYDFAHGKIRDVAYSTLSPATRRRNHRVIAAALVQLHPRNLDSVSGEVARHYDRAGQPADAAAWYQRAAVQAQRLHANIEAIRLLERARELVGTLPEHRERLMAELEILSCLPTPIAVVEGFASAHLAEIQLQAMELAEVLGVAPEPSLLRSLAMTSLCRGDFERGIEVAGQLQALASRSGDHVLMVESEYLLGIGAFWGAAMESARTHFERVVHQFEPARRDEHLLRFGQDPRIVCLSRLANTLWFLGFTSEAMSTRDAAMAMSTEVGHPFSHGVALVFAAMLSIELGETDRCREYMAAFIDNERHQPFAISQGALLGYVDVLDGRTEAGIARIREAIGTSSVDHAPGQRATHTRLLVAAYDIAGDWKGGLEAADEALRLVGTRIWEAENRRLRAVFLARLGAPRAEVERELADAANVARLRGLVELGRRVDRTRAELGIGT